MASQKAFSFPLYRHRSVLVDNCHCVVLIDNCHHMLNEAAVDRDVGVVTSIFNSSLASSLASNLASAFLEGFGYFSGKH